MKQKTKKFIGISSGLITLATLLIWYIFPFLAYQWYYHVQVGDFHKELKVAPIYVESLISAPQEWYDFNIGGLSFKVPNVIYKKVYSSENCVYFISEKETFYIAYNTPEEELFETIREKNLNFPIISYQDRVSMLKSVPTDISICNARGKNMQAYLNQILKFLSIPTGGLSESFIVDTKVLKGICMISEKRENGLSALAEIYSSDDEAIAFSVSLMRYNERIRLKTDLQKILSSIKVPARPFDNEVVRKDIDALPEKYRNMIGITH